MAVLGLMPVQKQGENLTVSAVIAQRNRLLDAPLWVHLLAWGAFGCITLSWIIFYYAYRDANAWLHWLGSDGAQNWPTGNETHFAERIHPNSIFRTRSNTWSNLGYVFVGVYILAYALYDFRRETSARDPYAVRVPALMAYFGLACVALGFGSAFMHASLTGTGGWYDIFAMFGSLVAMIALHWGRWLPMLQLGNLKLHTWPVLIAIAMPVSYLLAEVHGRFSDIQIMTGLIGTVVTSVCIDFALRQRSMQHRWYLLSALSFAIAFTIWNLTNAKRFTSPDDWYQGHGIWHVMTGFSLGFMAILYRSEVPTRPTEDVG